jgi:hypothetical protein
MTLPALEFEEVDISADLGFKVPVHIPNLLHLQMFSVAFIPFIDAPSLHSLKIVPWHKVLMKPLQIANNFARDIATLEITGEDFDNLVVKQTNHWDSVKKVIWTWDEPFAGSKTTTFRSVCSVEFRGASVHKPIGNLTREFNPFLIALLRYPDACPHLRTIKSDRHPAWALLTQVLLQRNRNNNVVQLEEIWLPSLPIQPILSLVVRLLRGGSKEVVPKRFDDVLMRRSYNTLL